MQVNSNCSSYPLQCVQMCIFLLQLCAGISLLETWTSTKALLFISDCLRQCSPGREAHSFLIIFIMPPGYAQLSFSHIYVKSSVAKQRQAPPSNQFAYPIHPKIYTTEAVALLLLSNNLKKNNTKKGRTIYLQVTSLQPLITAYF